LRRGIVTEAFLMHKTYDIQGMDCANCARELEEGVGRLAGIKHVQVDYATAKMTIEGEVPLPVLKQRVKAFGKTLVDEGTDSTSVPAISPKGGVKGFAQYLLVQTETRLALLGGGIIILALVTSLTSLPGEISNGLFITATLVAMYPIALRGINNLRINHDFNINLLMTIAALGAILIGETLEAATVIFLFAMGEALEGYNADRARSSLRGLMDLAPAQAIRLRRTDSQFLSISGEDFIPLTPISVDQEEIVPVEALQINDTILVKPGERIAMDGVVTAGSSGVNQAPITGESIPVNKTVASEVFAGTINGESALEVRVTRLAADNTLSQVIQLVEQAQSVRAPSQRLIDRFARYYTPGVVIVALLVAIIPPLVFSAPLYDVPGEGHGWLYRALALLVIACPCALVISTPVTIISAITAAARRGVLIKGGAYLEVLGQVRAIAFDKTGTLTHGKPVVIQTRSIDCATGVDCEKCDDVLALASAVERRSAHPLAQAVVNAAHARNLDHIYPPAEAVANLSGQGIQGQVNGQLVTVGSHKLFEDEHPHSHDLCQMVDQAEASGQTTMLLYDGERVRGFISVADEARADGQHVVAELNELGIETVMLTGDNMVVAKAIGQHVGVSDVRAELLPGGKVSAVQNLIRKHGTVAMVGDGINDTPALAAASVGVAMGGAGSAQALETADIALMADDLKQLPYAVRLSRFARRLIVQNITLSLGMKLGFMLLALAGEASLWMAVLADVGMSLAVTLNGMRPKRFEK
jgi:Cd2+/Zn2+-exporting ATPase